MIERIIALMKFCVFHFDLMGYEQGWNYSKQRSLIFEMKYFNKSCLTVSNNVFLNAHFMGENLISPSTSWQKEKSKYKFSIEKKLYVLANFIKSSLAELYVQSDHAATHILILL